MEFSSNGKPIITPEYDMRVAPVASKAFGAGPSRGVISDRTKKRIAPTNTNEDSLFLSQQKSSVIRPLSSSSNNKPKENGSLFSSLETKTSVIDFNSASKASLNSNKYDDIPTGNKKKKIKLISETDKQIDDFINNAKPPEPMSSSPDMFLSSSSENSQESISNMQSTSSSTSSKNEKENKKTESIAKYLHMVCIVQILYK